MLAAMVALISTACGPDSNQNPGGGGDNPPITVDVAHSGAVNGGTGANDPWPVPPADSGHRDLRKDCPDLRQGDQGQCVVELAWLLNLRGAHLHVTGLFGPVTLARVVQFQAARGRAATGVVDQVTKAALYQLQDATADWDLRTECVDLDYGAEGSCPRSLQHLLMRYGAPLKGTGKYLDNTETAVRAFQISHGMPATGKVGQETKQALYDNLSHPPTPTPSVTGTHGPCSLTECYVYLSRSSTQAIDAVLGHSSVGDAAALLLERAACSIARTTLTSVICSWGANLATQAIITVLNDAAARQQCVGVHLVLPHSYATLIPIRIVATDDPAVCTT